jgi:DNA-binding transcriptional LysR family regulator
MDRFKLMETYGAVVRAGSYTRAASELGVTRAMVSRRIQELESAVGARLLNRNTHGIAVTSIGADYFESCAGLLSELRAIEERTRANVASPKGELRILATKTFGEMVLAPLVAEFCALYPDIDVQITLGEGRFDPFAGNFDLAIRTLPVRDSALVTRAIVSLPRILVASPEYLARHGTPASPADLARHNCLDPSGAPHSTWEFRGPDGRKVVRISGTPRANTSTIIRHAALRGLGIAILREYLVFDDLRSGSLLRLLDDYELDKRTLHVVRPKDRHPPARVRLFVDFLADRMKDYAKDLKRPAA